MLNEKDKSWFWNVFGGAMMSIVFVLFLSHINNINNNIDKSFLSLKTEIKELSVVLDSQKERIVGLEKNREIDKEKDCLLENNLKNLENLLNENKQKLLVCETQILSMKEEIKMISETNKDYIKQIQTMKEKLAADEATKKAKQESTNPNP
jgi:chromosome segregation ATPase